MRIWKSVFADTKIQNMTHPQYDAAIADWAKYRTTFVGGKPFVNKYLERFSHREDWQDFSNRKRMSYCSAHAKASVMDIKNAIYQRMVDIHREGGAPSYELALDGSDNGVDYTGNSMNGFIGRVVLPELLSMAKVGIYVDKDPLPDTPNRNETNAVRPYIYIYKAEDIRAWTMSKNGILTSLLLADTTPTIDETTGLTVASEKSFRHLRLTASGVTVTFYDPDGKQTSTSTLSLNQIPFVISELSQSLLTDVADYQIALTNLASSDINYALKSNFPFYVEQFDIAVEMANLRTAYAQEGSGTEDGEATAAKTADKNQVELGTAQGRRYPKGIDAPQFIHPSPEPLLASMKKADQLKEEIRQLVNLAVSGLTPVRASAESKQEDNSSLEAGLSYIGMELQYTEQRVANIWDEYESFTGAIVVAYPETYSLKTDEDRRKEAKENIELIPNIPSKSYQKEVAKETITTLVGHRVSAEELKRMHNEIDKADIIVIDPEILSMDIENGLVTVKTASVARLYPEGEADRAKEEHAERIARIQVAQTDPAARGLKDESADLKATKDDKDASRQTDFDDKITDKTRGDAA
jgi:hypothetical protein